MIMKGYTFKHLCMTYKVEITSKRLYFCLKKDVHQNVWVINFKGCDEKTYIFIAERDIHSKKIV